MEKQKDTRGGADTSTLQSDSSAPSTCFSNFCEAAESSKTRSESISDESPILQMQRTFGNQAVSRTLQAKANGRAPARSQEQQTERHNPPGVHLGEVAREGISGSSTRLPHFEAIQKSFGPYDISGVEAHTDVAANTANEALGAVGYTTGNHIAFAHAPDLHTAAHEAAHVIQQRAGVQLRGGIVGEVGDDYEQNADAVAEQVVQGKSSEDLLSRYAGADTKADPDDRSENARHQTFESGEQHLGVEGDNGDHSFVTQRKIASPSAVIQLSPKQTHYGKFIDKTYKKIPNGVEMHLEFDPGAEVDAKAIGLIQSVKAVGAGKPVLTDPTQESRYVKSGPGEGYRIDRVSSRNNAIYSAVSLGVPEFLGNTKPNNAPTGTATPDPTNATYELGHHFNDGGTPKHKKAWLADSPTSEAPSNSGMTFETAALAIAGAQEGTYYGSVKWGWERDATGALKEIDFAMVSEGTPSQNFLAPVAGWNKATARGTLVARNDPTQVDKMSGSTFARDYDIDKGTKVTASGMIGALGEDRQIVTIVDGTKAGQSGYIKVPDLLDKGDGAATVDLPVPDVHVIDAEVVLNDGVDGPWRYSDKLPKGTRVVPTGKTTKTGLGPIFTIMKWVNVVQGPSTGASGFVPESLLRKERP